MLKNGFNVLIGNVCDNPIKDVQIEKNFIKKFDKDKLYFNNDDCI